MEDLAPTEKLAILESGTATCEEASMLSKESYIACGQPAIALVDNGDRQPYLMCFGCADHNEKNRGAVIIARKKSSDPSTDLIVEVGSIKSITTADQYSRAATLRGLVKDMSKAIADDKTPGIKSAKAHYELLRDELAERLLPLETEYRRLGGLLTAYNDEQERIKKRKELEIDAANKIAAEKEKAELVLLAKQLGDKNLAKEVAKAPVDLPNVVVTKDVPSVDGLSYTENWHYSVEDLMLLVRAVAAGKVPIQALTDPTKPFRSGYLHKQTTALKSMLQYPGVKVWSTREPRQS